MRTKDRLWIGAALILTVAAVGYIRGYAKAQYDVAAFHEATVQGRLGFKLVISQHKWKEITKDTLGFTSALIDENVHHSINQIIEEGIARRHLPCSHTWLLTQIGEAEHDTIMFVGICYKPSELHSTSDANST